MFERIRHMLVKEFIQVLRDPRMKAVIFVIPVVQLMVFGYAVTTDVRRVTTAVYDLDNSVVSRDLTSRFLRSGYFDVVEHVYDDQRAAELLDRGAVQALLRMDRGFGEALHAGRAARLQLILDGTDSNTAGVVLSYATKIAQRFSSEALAERITRTVGAYRRPGGVELEMRAWFNDNLESRNYYVPGVTLLLTSMAVVREKEIGTMEQIMVTPITTAEFILGKALPFALIGFADMILVTVVGTLWFHVPIRGSLLLLLLATGLYLMSGLGAGLLISTISRTQQQAMMSAFFFYFPAVLLSGFMFPIANMPRPIQWFTYLDPLRYYLVVVRGIFLKGVGLRILWPQFLALAVMGHLTLAVATKRFRKTVR
jgi:ABC-2 type transport system permease protein